MQVYEVTAQYHLVRLGNEEPLDRAELIVRYMEGAFDNEPTVESIWVIALNTKLSGEPLRLYARCARILLAGAAPEECQG